MEQKDQVENKEYQFIREKVVSRRKSRIKKMVWSFGFTVFLAAVFGIVARAVFLCADKPLKHLLGFEGELSPTPTPHETPTKGVTPSGSTGEPERTNTPKPPTPGGILTPEATSTPGGTPTGAENLETPTGVDPSGEGENVPTGVSPSGEGENVPTGASPSGEGENVPTGASPSGTGENVPTGASPSGTGENVPTGIDPSGTGSGTITPTPEISFAEQYGELFSGLQKIAHEVQHSLVTITVSVNGIDWLDNPYETESQTTGVVIGQTAEELLLLVNLDRVQSASRISLTVDREDYEAQLLNYDRDYNIAVVRTNKEELPESFLSGVKVAVFGESATLAVGTPILALGNPNGYVGSMDFGVVTSRQSVYYITDNSVDLFNTSTIDSEDGDGVIVNFSGEIVGIITRTMKAGFDESICTAVGITKLKRVIERLAAGQKQVYFGVRGDDVPREALNEKGLSSGIYVMEVETDSPAFKAGIKTGDIITKVDNNFVYTFSGFNSILNLREPGMAMKVTLWRTVRMKAEEIEVTVKLGERNKAD